jgi:ABC-2 type transport system ATP-binding protein
MISAEHLTMHYGPVVALDNVSFDVAQGEIVGLLGPNGAGKSTTMKILTTYLHPTKGRAKVCNMDVLEDPLGVRKVIGYLPELLPLYMDMEVREYLSFVGRARGLTGVTLRNRTGIVLDACGLRPMYRKVIRELSKGYKQRTALAQALIHDPDIIILDEPTSGLDPHQILEVRKLVRELASGKTVMLSTHILQEVEASCDRIIIIDRGRIVGNGTYEELRDKAMTFERAQVTVQGAEEEIKRLLSGMSGVTNVDLEGSDDGFVSFVVSAKRGTAIWQEVAALGKAKSWTLRELTTKPLSLEETFLALTEHESASNAGSDGEAA